MNQITPPVSPSDTGLYVSIRNIVLSARSNVRQAVNDTMVQTYWQIGRLIVEHEQGGSTCAEYGKKRWKLCRDV